MFNFKKTKEQATAKETTQAIEKSYLFDDAASKINQEGEENKKVHGQDGVCCGSCGGD
jgi:CCGSCS motif protein